MTIEYSSKQLVSLIKQNSRDAFNYLYTNYSTAILIVINNIINDKHTSEDILQEVFVSIWMSISQYDAEKGCLYTWMRNIAKNKAIDFTRCGINNMRSRTDRNENKIHLHGINTEQKTDHIGLSGIVNKLSEHHQVLICLVYYKGHTIEEIAYLLDVPLGTIKSRMRRALGLLREDFKYAQ